MLPCGFKFHYFSGSRNPKLPYLFPWWTHWWCMTVCMWISVSPQETSPLTTYLLLSSWALQSILPFLGTGLDFFPFLYSLGIYSLSPISPALRMHLHSYRCRHLYPFNIVWTMAITSYMVSWLPSRLCPRQFSTEERCNLWAAIYLITLAAFHPALNNTQSSFQKLQSTDCIFMKAYSKM